MNISIFFNLKIASSMFMYKRLTNKYHQINVFSIPTCYVVYNALIYYTLNIFLFHRFFYNVINVEHK